MLPITMGMSAYGSYYLLDKYPLLRKGLGASILSYSVYKAYENISSAFPALNLGGGIFENKIRVDPFVVVISGCDSGFGNILANKLLNLSNCIVFAGCYTEGGVNSFLAKNKKNVFPHRLDVTNTKSIKDFVEFVKQNTNGQGIDCLVNNAGTADDNWLVDFVEIKHFRKVMDINFFGVVEMTKEFLPLLKIKAKKMNGLRPRVINIASMLGRIVIPATATYTCSKHAVVAFCDSLRREMVPFGIDVACVEPGFFKTTLVTNSFNVIQRLWDEAPQEIRDQYGEYYIEKAKKEMGLFLGNDPNIPTSQAAMNFLKDGIMGDPENVAQNLFFACAGERKPPVRMIIGLDYHLALRPVSLLPTEIQDLIFGVAFGASGALPVSKPKL